jgi:hypothetical protein
MKRIQLRVVPDERFPPGTPEHAANILSWAEAIRQVLRRPLDPQKGADIEEIRRGIRILDALERGGEVLELEDADWEHLCAKTRAMQWAFVDRRIVAFVDDVLQVTFDPIQRGNGQMSPQKVVS